MALANKASHPRRVESPQTSKRRLPRGGEALRRSDRYRVARAVGKGSKSSSGYGCVTACKEAVVARG